MGRQTGEVEQAINNTSASVNRLTLHALHNYQENQLREFKERLIRAEGDNDMCKIPLPRTAHIYGNDIEQSQENAKQFVDI